jgi:hypothetical protein
VRFDILGRRNARPRWRIYSGSAPRVIHEAYHTPNTISDICSSLDRSAVSHTPPPVLAPHLRMEFGHSMFKDELVGFQEQEGTIDLAQHLLYNKILLFTNARITDSIIAQEVIDLLAPKVRGLLRILQRPSKSFMR